MDSCIYTKMGEEDDEYCFKGANIPGTTECSVRYFAVYVTSLFKDAFQVLSTEPSTTDTTTEAPSAEALTNEKAALEEDLEKDKEELANLEAEEEAASAVDAEIDGVEAKIEQLTQGTGEDSGSQRVRRQAATTCVEVGTLVDEMTKERETAKKLVLIIVILITVTLIISSSSSPPPGADQEDHHLDHPLLHERGRQAVLGGCQDHPQGEDQDGERG